MGLCKSANKLKFYTICQPVLSALLILFSISNAFGLNGFIRVGHLFGDSKGFAAVLALMVSLGFLLCGLFSGFIYVRIWREKDRLVGES